MIIFNVPRSPTYIKGIALSIISRGGTRTLAALVNRLHTTKVATTLAIT